MLAGTLDFVVAVLVAAVAYFGLGAVWYNPKVFGAAWMRLVGRSPEDLGDAKQAMILGGLSAVVAAVALGALIMYGGWLHWVDGVGIGALAGVGLVVPVTAMNYVFAGRPLQLFFLDSTYHVVGFVLMGAILGGVLGAAPFS